MPTVNPIVVIVGLLQLVAAGWALYSGDWKMAVINVGVGIANITLGTMAVSK